MKKQIRLKAHFADTVARNKLGLNEIADKASIARSTIYALQNPTSHPHRKGGMHRKTAWNIVNAFASATGMDPDTAWEMLIEEVEIDTPQAKHTPRLQEA